MPDVGLPPVGELVQITTTAGVKLAAIYERDGGFTLVGPREPGTGSWLPGYKVESWCRVLVVPDTEETIERVIAELMETMLAQWGHPVSEHIEKMWRSSARKYLLEVWAAVRGAAIR